MTMELSAVFLTVFLLIVNAAAKVNDGGFGSQYEWLSLDDGMKAAKENEKPVMVLIHKSWCGACKALKPQFASSAAIEKLSQEFNMVIGGDDEEPTDAKFALDGKYVPRIYFMSPDGTVMEDIKNEQGNPSYKYFYPSPEGIVASMSKVLKSGPAESASKSQEEL